VWRGEVETRKKIKNAGVREKKKNSIRTLWLNSRGGASLVRGMRTAAGCKRDGVGDFWVGGKAGKIRGRIYGHDRGFSYNYQEAAWGGGKFPARA